MGTGQERRNGGMRWRDRGFLGSPSLGFVTHILEWEPYLDGTHYIIRQVHAIPGIQGEGIILDHFVPHRLPSGLLTQKRY